MCHIIMDRNAYHEAGLLHDSYSLRMMSGKKFFKTGSHQHFLAAEWNDPARIQGVLAPPFLPITWLWHG